MIYDLDSCLIIYFNLSIFTKLTQFNYSKRIYSITFTQASWFFFHNHTFHWTSLKKFLQRRTQLCFQTQSVFRTNNVKLPFAITSIFFLLKPNILHFVTENVVKQVCNLFLDWYMQKDIFAWWQSELDHHNVRIAFIVFFESLSYSSSFLNDVVFADFLFLWLLIYKFLDLLFNEFILHVHELFLLLLNDFTILLNLDLLCSRWLFLVVEIVDASLEKIVTLKKLIFLFLNWFTLFAEFLQLINNVGDLLICCFLVLLFQSLNHFIQLNFSNKFDIFQIVHSQYYQITLFSCRFLEVLLKIRLQFIILHIENVIQKWIVCHSLKLLVCQ